MGQKEGGALTKTGTIGAGKTGAAGGVGMGTQGGGPGTSDAIAYGPEFTITFSTNPGVLRTIELDTRQITNPGRTDYWVANARQGQFSSRYSTNVGRIQNLNYGSKLLYTNNDWRTTVPVVGGQGTLVKVGGQETYVTAVTAQMVTLHDPFLGTTITPLLTDTKISGTAMAAADGKVAFVNGIGPITQ